MMMLRSLVALALVASVASQVPAESTIFLQFVQQLGGSMCNQQYNDCSSLPGPVAPGFTIHGLWPNYYAGSWPQFCDSSATFSESAISALMSKMNYYWPSYQGPYSEFWTHEYTKHGTCAETAFPTEESFFNAVLNLRANNDLMSMLNDAGMYQGSDKRYQPSDIADAIKQVVGHTPFIQCNSNQHDQYQIQQISVCYDTSLNAIECPAWLLEPQYQNCGYEGVFLPAMPASASTSSSSSGSSEYSDSSSSNSASDYVDTVSTNLPPATSNAVLIGVVAGSLGCVVVVVAAVIVVKRRRYASATAASVV